MQVRLALFTLFVAWEDVRGCFRTYRNHLCSIHTDSDALDLPEPAPPPITSLVCGDGGGGGDDSEEDTTSTTAHNCSSSDLLQEAAL